MTAHQYPQIVTALPGPKAAKIIRADKQRLSTSYTRDFPMVVEKGEGALIYDVDGNVFLDFCAGIAVCSTGHCHPEVVAAIKDQADNLLHMSGTDFYYKVQSDLAAQLCKLAPGKEKKRIFFTNSGAESVEAAIKLVKYKTRRPRLLAFLGAFHGRTNGALSLTGSKVVQKEGFAPLLPGVTHIPYPDPYRGDKNGQDCLDYLEKTVFQKIVPPKEVAAIFFEPIQGEGGYVVPPQRFVEGLREITRKHGILLVADEVQAGMGRTGKMFASEHYGLEPDVICLAKGIASGMPLGAIIARNDVMDWPYGSHASTFGGNPVACAASLKTLDLLEGGLIENSEKRGKYLQSKLKALQKKHSCMGDVRGKGLMVGVEIVTDKKSKNPAPELRDTIVMDAFYKGLIILGCGPNTLRFAPSLIVNKQHIDCAVGIIDKVLKKLRK